MIIPLDDKLRIHGVRDCYQVEQLRNYKGGQEWRPIKYYSKFAHALKAAAEREIRTHPANNLVEAIEAADAIVARYSRLLDGALDEIAKRDAPDVRMVS